MTEKDSSTVYKHPCLKPFNEVTWLCILGTFFLTSVTVSLIMGRSIQQGLFNFLAMLLRQPVNFKEYKLADIILYASWLLFAFVISSCYSATFLAHLTLPDRPQPLQSFMDVSNAVQLGTHRCIVLEGSSTKAHLQLSNEEHIAGLYKHIVQNNWFFKSTDQLTPATVKDSVVVLDRSLLQALITRLGIESYELSKDVHYFSNVAMAFRKDFCCKKELNKVLSRLSEAGILGKLLSDYQSKNRIISSFTNLEKSDERQTFSKSIYILFIMTVIIYGAACLVLIAEVVYSRYH